jgi:RNA polymerase sigma-70 factor (ECF subfamily)
MSVATLTERRTISQREQREVVSTDDSFEKIYDAYHGRIFGLAYRMMGNADEALDVTQDAFISAYQNLHKLTPQCNPGGSEAIYLSAWLHRIAANKCIDALRQRKRRAGVDWDTFVATAPVSTDSDRYPESYTIDREREAEIQRVLDQMSPNYRAALLMHEYQGLSVREVAQALGRTESAVKSLLFRAREQFRALYGLEAVLQQAA